MSKIIYHLVKQVTMAGISQSDLGHRARALALSELRLFLVRLNEVFAFL